MENLKRHAEENLRRLAENPYPGRGIVLGRSHGGRLLQFYWVMGRSESSRNRVLVREGREVRTQALDPAKVEDPSLVIYTCMREARGQHLVSNGDHTETLAEAVAAGKSLHDALASISHEPDPPHLTPRIAGGISPVQTAAGAGSPLAWLAIVKADRFDGARSDRFFFQYADLPPGYGWCLTTYRGDGQPLPSFEGTPYLLPLNGSEDDLLPWLWHRLNEKNRVAIVLKIIEPDSSTDIRIVNKYGGNGA